MARPYLTTESFLESVRSRAAIPDSPNFLINDSSILQFSSDEMVSSIVPIIKRTQEEYLLRTEIVPLVADQSRYLIPNRSMVNSLRDLAYLNTNNSEQPMTRINYDDRYVGNYNTSSSIYSYYVKNNAIVLVPEIRGTPTGSLVFTFLMRPNQLVLENRIAVIEAIDVLTGEVTVTDIPDIFSLTTLLDFVQVSSPHIILDYDILPTAINTTTNVITFDPDDLPDDLSVGDNICIANETNIPNIPSELHQVLVAKTVERCMEGLADQSGYAIASKTSQQSMDSGIELMKNRVTSSPIKMVNRHGFLSRRKNMGWRF